jgi:beta-lactamase regulating signal transducer with metallopeptidase domain
VEIELLSAIARANLAAGAAIVVILLMRRPVRAWFGARSAYALWLLAPIAALASLMPARRIVEVSPPYHALPGSDVTAAPLPLPVLDAAPATLPPSGISSPTPLFEAASLAEIASANAATLLGLWAAGAFISFAWLIWRQQRYVASLGRLDREAAGVFRAQRSGVGPALIGALRPRIVLPADFESRFSAGERALILSHEQAHLSAGDAQINGLIAVFGCLCWFNPLVQVAAHRARQDQELACDSVVVSRHPAERRRYAEALLKTQMSEAVPLGCAWPAGAAHPLRERIALLTNAAPAWPRRTLGGAIVATACLTGGAAAWSAQPAVHVVQARPTPVDTTTAQMRPLANDAAEPEAMLSPAAVMTTPDAQRFPNMRVELAEGAALLRVIAEDRSDIAVSITGSSRLPTPTARIANDRLIIDGGLGEDAHRCQRRFSGEGSAYVPGRGVVLASDLPVIVLRTPRTLDLHVRGVVSSQIGDLAGGRIQIDGCGDAHIGTTTQALNVGLYGFGNVRVDEVQGALRAQLFGIGDLSVARAGRDAQIDLIGEGDLTTGSIAGALTARMQGSGVMNIADVGAGAALQMPGSGAMRIGPVSGALAVAGNGSGDIDVASIRGPALTIDLRGSSELTIAAGETGRMNVEVRGSASVDFDGHAREVIATLGEGARDVRVTRADHIETRRANGVYAEVVTSR